MENNVIELPKKSEKTEPELSKKERVECARAEIDAVLKKYNVELFVNHGIDVSVPRGEK